MAIQRITLNINGVDRDILCNPEQDSLADVVRRLGLTGTKIGCGTGQCGACTLLLDGEVTRSCVKKMKHVRAYARVETIEGIGSPENLHPLQQAFITYAGVQCGFCSPGFIMSATNSAVQVVCNATLQRWGGDVYVGVMTVLNSVREITTTPVMGITNAAQPVIGFNFGAGEYKRVRSGIQFMSAVCVGYTAAVWLCLFLFPQAFIRLFTSDPALLAAGVPSMHVYFFGFFMMALQFAGQSTNTALGRARQAVFFSLLRKAVIVIPLTLWLPGRFGLGVNGVFLAEPISNFLGGGACFVTMLLTVWPDLKRRERLHASGARG